MGQEIGTSRFRREDFEAFRRRMAEETALLLAWSREGRLSEAPPVAGLEVEAWLVDAEGLPAPVNEAVLDRLRDPLVVPELARFNVELNVPPEPLRGGCLGKLERHLAAAWGRCAEAARAEGAFLVTVGILPSVAPRHLTQANMSALRRYRALNEQVLAARAGRPLHLDIVGREHLRVTHRNVMLESAATSLQVHLQVPASRAARYLNASMITSAATVAVAANAPYLFGRDLWDETRIPLFEQAVEVGGYEGAAQGPIRRVTFGSGYVRQSVLECFLENRDHYPVLLPARLEEPSERLPHLRFHNGTIWRWNRPLVGFDSDGRPHLRIEHRVMAAGPSLRDQIANAAFYFGLVASLAAEELPPEDRIPFPQARDNFYAAARYGLEAVLTWLDGRRRPLAALLEEELLPRAREALEGLGVAPEQARSYLEVVVERVALRRTGAAWQRAWCAQHGRDMPALVRAYRRWQAAGLPVHRWGLEAS